MHASRSRGPSATPTLTSTATHAAGAVGPRLSLADLPVPDGSEPFAHVATGAAAAAAAACRALLLGHTLGHFFVMGQAVTEVFSVFDASADVTEATRLTRHAAAMKVASLRSANSAGGPQRTFELARARLLKPRPLLEALLRNVYAEAADPAAPP